MKFAASSIVTVVSLAIVGCQDANVKPATTDDPAPVSTADSDMGTNKHRESSPNDPAEGSTNPKDEDVTANIRQELMKTKMAVNVQGIKIVTQDGKVILRGVVKSAEEKQQVELIAQNIAGTQNVANWLEVE